MTTASIAGLIAFINAQPVDRTINHNSWASCAVGDYAREQLNHIIPDTRKLGVGHNQVHVDAVMVALWQETGTSSWLTATLRNLQQSDQRTLMDVMQSKYLVETYGELAGIVNDPSCWDNF